MELKKTVTMISSEKNDRISIERRDYSRADFTRVSKYVVVLNGLDVFSELCYSDAREFFERVAG